jgi:hypothetical protein
VVVLPLKNAVLFAAACLLALLVAEGLVRYVVGYPTYGVRDREYGLWSGSASQPVFKARSKYWTVEGGNRVFARNNLGLPGTDVRPSGAAPYVFVLGDSYVQGYEVPPDSMATSVFGRLLDQEGHPASVLNLGRGGYDPFNCYFRASYFARLYPPAAVILVLQSDYEGWFLRRPDPLRFIADPRAGQSDRRSAVRLHNAARNASAFANLVIKAAYENQRVFDESAGDGFQDVPRDGARHGSKKDPSGERPGGESLAGSSVPPGLLDSLREFRKSFGRGFICVSIVDDQKLNEGLAAFARSDSFTFASRPLNRPEFKINGAGHLNAHGHARLGELLDEAYQRNLEERRDATLH